MKDILDTIKDRLSNPFLISFAIAWLICNWQITVGLIWYNAENLNLMGYPSYLALIENYINYKFNVYWPLIIALGYTFVFPIFKVIVNYFNALLNRIDETNLLRISSKGSISTRKYLDLQKTYDTSIKELSDIINTEGELKQENVKLEQILITETAKVNHLQGEFTSLQSYSSGTRLNGLWNVEINEKFFKTNTASFDFEWLANAFRLGKSFWKIDELNIAESNDISEFTSQKFRIVTYVCDPFDSKFVMSIRLDDHTNQDFRVFSLPVLEWQSDGNVIIGKGIFMSKVNGRVSPS